MEMIIKSIDLESVLPEVLPMMAKHYKEISHLDGEFDPDVDRYVALNKAGSYEFIVAQIGGAIVGYAGYFVAPHQHSKSNVVAYQDMIYLEPICRGGGLGRMLIQECDNILKSKSVVSVINAVSTKNDFGQLLETMGYMMLDKLYTRRL